MTAEVLAQVLVHTEHEEDLLDVIASIAPLSGWYVPAAVPIIVSDMNHADQVMLKLGCTDAIEFGDDDAIFWNPKKPQEIIQHVQTYLSHCTCSEMRLLNLCFGSSSVYDRVEHVLKTTLTYQTAMWQVFQDVGLD